MSFYLILIATLLITYGLPWFTTGQIGSTRAGLTIAFKGVGNGLDPQGNRFNINELKSDEVLEKAIKETGLHETLTVDELKKRVFILPQVEADTLKELLTLSAIDGKTQDIKERMIYPTTFTVGIKDMWPPSIFMDFKDRLLLNNILKAYDGYLKSKYLSEILIKPAYSSEEIVKLDYPEMMLVLNQEAESLLLFIDSYAKNEPTFISDKSGLAFADVYQQALLLQDTDIGSMRSLVNYYELTDDVPSRILYEEAMLKRAGVVAGKLSGAQYFTSDILQIYDNSSNYIFAADGAGSVEISSAEDQFYSKLMAALVDKQAAYINAKYNQQDILRAIEKLRSDNLSGQAYLDLGYQIKSGTLKAMTRIEALREQTREMAEEVYEETIQNKIYIGKAGYSLNSNGNIIVNFAVLAVLLILIKWLYYDLQHSDFNRYLEVIQRRFRRK